MTYQPRLRNIAHLGSVELFAPRLAETTDFFVRLMSLDEVARHGDSLYLHAWDDYEARTLKITQRDHPGVGRTSLRASDPDALRRRVDALTDAGVAGSWRGDEPASGPTWVCADPDGHEFGLYWETSFFRAAPDARPALNNQAAPFPGRGANVRRLDHVNYLTGGVPATDRFVEGLLKARPTEQIALDDGARAAVW